MAITTHSHDIDSGPDFLSNSLGVAQPDPLLTQWVSLKDIFLECLHPHQINDELTLLVMQDGEVLQTLGLAKISPTQWRSESSISLSPVGHADIQLCIQSRDRTNEAFYTITTDEIYVAMSAEEGTTVNYACTLINENNAIGCKIVSAISFQTSAEIEEILEIHKKIKALDSLFEHTGDIAIITRIISLYEKLLTKYSTELRSPESALIPTWCNNLGKAYLSRFKHTGDAQDIECGITHLQNAVQSGPSGLSSLSSRRTNLENAYLFQFAHTGDIRDIGNAISQLRDAGQPTLAGDSDLFSRILTVLSDSSRMMLNNFAGAMSSSVADVFAIDRADLALEWLELGRCMVWNQLGQLSILMGKLMTANKALAERFIKAQMAPTLETSHQYGTLNDTLDTTEYERLLNEIRDLPGFHGFLKPPQSSTILSVIPKDGPIIMFNAFSARCDVLALIPGAETPLHIPLRNFTLEDASKLQNMLQSNILRHRGVEDGVRLSGRRLNQKSMSHILKVLWNKVVHPILEALEFSVPQQSSNRPRLWWCPTGPFSFLPLHAAGIFGADYQPGSCVSDFVISSYTPTVSSLCEKFTASTTSSNHTKILLVNQPNTPGLSPIPATTKETHAIEDMMKEEPHVTTMLLENAEATVEKVKSAMNSHNWVHFACHGVQDRTDPLRSGVCLHDGRLPLLEIMQRKIPNSEFAFLSACQTSKGDVELSDEVVHLAAGMLTAGYRGVVGTMWSISDFYGPDFARFFYQYLRQDTGLDSTRAAYALDDATRKVREKLKDDETSFLTWVPYVHFGY